MAPSEVIDLEYVSIGVSQLVNVFACSKEGHYKCQKLMAYYLPICLLISPKVYFKAHLVSPLPQKIS